MPQKSFERHNFILFIQQTTQKKIITGIKNGGIMLVKLTYIIYSWHYNIINTRIQSLQTTERKKLRGHHARFLRMRLKDSSPAKN